jgi:hypothetical protein
MCITRGMCIVVCVLHKRNVSSCFLIPKTKLKLNQSYSFTTIRPNEKFRRQSRCSNQVTIRIHNPLKYLDNTDFRTEQKQTYKRS